jgi:DNA-binding XRE family transcriptional regulator
MRCCLIAIEHAHIDKGLTREDLAERIRKSERYVAAIERGERTPSLKTCDTYVHSMDEHKRREMDKMDDMFWMQYSVSIENQPYPVLCTLSADGCTAHVPDFPKIVITASTLDAALLEVKQQIQKALHQYKNPPIPTKQEQIVVPQNSVLVLIKAS